MASLYFNFFTRIGGHIRRSHIVRRVWLYCLMGLIIYRLVCSCCPANFHSDWLSIADVFPLLLFVLLGMFTYMKDSRCHWFSSWKCDNYSEFQLVGTVSFTKKKQKQINVWWYIHSFIHSQFMQHKEWKASYNERERWCHNDVIAFIKVCRYKLEIKKKDCIGCIGANVGSSVFDP